MKTEYSVEKPLNREPDTKDLTSQFITGEGYDRNHGPIPHIDGSKHAVHVDGAVQNTFSLSIKQLQDDFKQHSVVCALQCAGNRRHTMRTLLKEVEGIDWGDGAVMNCQWKGPRLRDVLLKAGIAVPGADRARAHVAFACFATQCQDDTWYGASIPLSRAIDPNADAILALEMNGLPLEPNHGFPVRVIVPGIAGARSVKWLDRITVQLTESSNFYQQHDYKILPPEAVDKQSAAQYWHVTPAVQDMPVNSVVTEPQDGSRISTRLVKAKGYALPGGADGPVKHVEVSGDGGSSWTRARLVHPPNIASSSHSNPPNKWTWELWEADVKVVPGRDNTGRIISRATDARGNTQEAKPVWNLRGVAYNGYGEARNLIFS